MLDNTHPHQKTPTVDIFGHHSFDRRGYAILAVYLHISIQVAKQSGEVEGSRIPRI